LAADLNPAGPGLQQLLRIWDLFSVVAHGLDTWGAADIVRTLIAPFRHNSASRGGTA
jgi:hypothetical protein